MTTSHSDRVKVLFHSNYSRMKTGFGKNMRNVLLALFDDPDIEVMEAANGGSYGSDLKTPWKSYGTLPSDRAKMSEIQGNSNKMSLASYGYYEIDRIIEESGADVYVGIEDVWAFGGFGKKEWWSKMPTIIWTTLDSEPLTPEAFEMSKNCDKMFVWASFSEKILKSKGFENAETLHGAIDYSNFKSLANKKELRRKHGIDDTFLMGFVFKNQLRKSAPNLIDAFVKIKAKHPEKNPKLLLHTNWGEIERGWDIPRLIKDSGVDQKDILCTHVCSNCGDFVISEHHPEERDCPHCGGKNSLKQKGSDHGVDESRLNEIYNCLDLYIHPFTSGGQEIPIQEAKAAGLVTLVTEYSCGLDSCYAHQGGIPLKWYEYREINSQFIKASTCSQDICDQVSFFLSMSESQKKWYSDNAKKYVKEKFSIPAMAARLKKEILRLHKQKPVTKTDKNKESEKSEIYFYKDLVGDSQEDRLAVVMPNCSGDVLIINSFLENLKSLYPEKKIHVFTKKQFFPMIDDNPFCDKLIEYQDGIDNLLLLEGQGANKGYFEIAFLPHIGTQKILNYLHNGKDRNQFEIL